MSINWTTTDVRKTQCGSVNDLCGQVSRLQPAEFLMNVDRFEKKRREEYEKVYTRNQSYWRELRKLQREGIIDCDRFVSELECRVRQLRKFSTLECHPTGSDSSVTSPLPVASSHSPFSRQSAGSIAIQAFKDFDSALSKHWGVCADLMEKEVLPLLIKKIDEHEKEVQKLWQRGKLLLISSASIDTRVAHHFEQLSSAVQGSQSLFSVGVESTAGLDLWLCTARYANAVQRHRRTIAEVNRQFRVLFQIAKEIDSARVALISRIAETVSLKLGECWQSSLVSSQSTTEVVRRIPQLLLQSQSSLSDELSRRVSDQSLFTTSSSSKSLSSLHSTDSTPSLELPFPDDQDIDLHGDCDDVRHLELNNSRSPISARTGEEQLTTTSTGMDNDAFATCVSTEATVSLFVPLMRRVFACSLEQSGILLTDWSPVLIVLSTSSALHLFSSSSAGNDANESVNARFTRILQAERLFYERDLRLQNQKDRDAAKKQQPVDTQQLNQQLQQQPSRPQQAEAPIENADLQRLMDSTTMQCLEESTPDTLRRELSGTVAIDAIVHPSLTMNLTHCSVQMTPSAIDSETIVTITERVPSSSWLFFWSSFDEQKIVLKMRSQRDAVDFVSLFTK